MFGQSVRRFPGAVAFTASAETCTSTGNGSAQALTLTVVGKSYIALTQSDPDGCALTLSETSAQDGQILTVVNISANSASFADSSGVQEMTGGTTVTLAQWAAVSFIYRSDRWVAQSGGGGGSGAPTSATYITQTADGTLSAEQAMGLLATGIVKSTTTSGVQSIAAAGTDYVAPGAVTTSGLTQATARILGRTTASTGAIEELTSVPATLGGTGLTALPTDDQILVSNGSVNQPKSIPDCNVITEKLLYDDATNVFSCQTDQVASGAGSGDFVGPASATDEALVRFDTTTGKLGQNSSITLSDTGALTFPDGVKQTFNPNGTTAGLNVGSQAGDPGTPADGDVWYDSTANELTGRINGANVALGAGGGGASITQGTYASLPGTCATSDLYFFTNSFYDSARCSATNTWTLFLRGATATAPVDGDFAWVNQGSATVSTTNGGIYLSVPVGTSLDVRARVKTAPSAPYTITVAFRSTADFALNNQDFGLVWRQSGDGKLATCGIQTATTGIKFISYKWTSPTVVSAEYSGSAIFNSDAIYFRLADDNTNRICSYSVDGQNFIAFHTIGRTDFLTADQVGFWAMERTNTYPIGLTILSWAQ